MHNGTDEQLFISLNFVAENMLFPTTSSMWHFRRMTNWRRDNEPHPFDICSEFGPRLSTMNLLIEISVALLRGKRYEICWPSDDKLCGRPVRAAY